MLPNLSVPQTRDPEERKELSKLSRRSFLSAASALAAVTAMAPEAMAQEVCADRDTIVAKLNNELGEVRVDGVAAGPSAFYEFFASESTRNIPGPA